MKNFRFTVLIMLPFILMMSCSKEKTLNDRLNDLENIIGKYRPEFKNLKHGSKEYSDMTQRYNKEIFAWAEEFELHRYERVNNEWKRDPDGKRIPVKEWPEVEKRFYEINNDMTRMVLTARPKETKRKPIVTDDTKNNIPKEGEPR